LAVIDLANETTIPLSKIPKRFPHLGRDDGEGGGKRLCFSTVWRWVSKGVLGPDGRRVKLEALKLGGQLVTTEQALQRFAEQLTPPAEDRPTQATTSRSLDKRRRASERAAQKLEQIGI
jgi:hypothetical protein